ncbi:MAG: SDR family NAD(P)-dependent oxidoreductase [Nitrospiraceae bacterium]
MEPGSTSRPFGVITGASRGIGAEYARALAGRGYDLLLVSRDKARMDQLAFELTSRHAIAAVSEALDLAQEDAAHRLYVAARQRRPHVDLLVNNAGFGLYGEFVNMPMARVQAMLRLHVNTIVESIRLFLPAMIERRAGGIINVASIAGFYSVPYMAEYAATKAFLIAFSEALAEEVASSSVRVQACCPGSRATDFHATAGFRPKNPVRVQTPAEVVSASLSALEHGQSVVTTGWQWRALAALSRLMPRHWLTRMAARSMKPWR